MTSAKKAAQILASKRKRFGRKAVLAPCRHCGQAMGTVERRKHEPQCAPKTRIAKWKLITPDSLPTSGDEVVRGTMGEFDRVKYGGPAVVLNVTALFEWDSTSAEEFVKGGWTHYRAIDAPVIPKTRQAKEQG
jgi:hypothetical protein